MGAILELIDALAELIGEAALIDALWKMYQHLGGTRQRQEVLEYGDDDCGPHPLDLDDMEDINSHGEPYIWNDRRK